MSHITELKLTALDHNNIVELLADSLKTDQKAVEDLTSLVEGTPLFGVYHAEWHNITLNLQIKRREIPFSSNNMSKISSELMPHRLWLDMAVVSLIPYLRAC